MMVDEDAVNFAAMMYLAGVNKAVGGTVVDLETVKGEQFREAKDIAAREIQVFKRNVKRARKAS